MSKDRRKEILRILKKTYPDAKCELNFSNPLQLLVATILSAQCTDVRVNMVTPDLFRLYPNIESFAKAKLSDLEEAIRSTGFFHNKAKNIIACTQQIIEKHKGKVPADMDALCALPGIGRKTANVILGNVFGMQEGIVVDTHVIRLSERLGLSKHKDPVKIERDLMEIVPKKDWTLVSHLITWHGRRRCSARKPDCQNCELKKICPSFPIKA